MRRTPAARLFADYAGVTEPVNAVVGRLGGACQIEAPARLFFNSLTTSSRSGRETIAEHRKTTKGFRLGRLVLNNVPVLGELAVIDAHDIDGDP